MSTVNTQNALGFQYSLFTNGDFISASNNLCIGNNIVINSTGLGPNIVNSNLTSLGTITNLTASSGSIGNLYVGSSTVGSINTNTFYAGSSTIGTLYTSYATSSNLSSSSGTINNLYSNSGTIGNLATNLLQLNQGTSNTLFVKSGTINNLSITNGTASNFYIQSGTISNLIVNGNTNNIPPIYITSATPNLLPANNYFNGTNGTLTSNTTPATQNISLQAANSIWTQGAFIASSDQRIKTNIKIADTSIALQNILDLPLMSFSYIDTIENGSSPVVGMIAQNVKQVVPEAITLALGTIPSIYKLAENIELVDENVLLTVSYNDNNMMIEGKLELTVEDIGKILVDIIDLGINTITVSKWDNFDITKNVFIYGPQINDFHTVDEPYLGILCMGGIQELNNRINTSVNSINSSISSLSTNVDTNVNTINQTLDTINSHLLFLDNTTQTANGNITILQTNTTSLMNLMDTIYRGTNSLTLTNSIPIQEPITSDIMVGNILLGYDSNNHTSIQSVIPADYSLAGGRLDLCTTRSNKDPRQIPRISILSGAGGNGNVGIGTTNPSTNLDVIGTARITKTLLVNNIVMGSTTLKNSGNNSTNFILPDSNGNNGNVLMTDGNGKTNWNDISNYIGLQNIINNIDQLIDTSNNNKMNINILLNDTINNTNIITNISNQVNKNNSDISILQTYNTLLLNLINKIKNNTTQATDNISIINNAIESLNIKIDNNNIDTNKLITDNTNIITDLSNQVNKNNSDISILQTYNTLLLNLINKINNNTTQATDNINIINNTIDSLNIKIDNNNKDISILQNNNIDTNKLITDNTDRIFNVSNQVNKNNSDISILQTYNTLLLNLINKINNNTTQATDNINIINNTIDSLNIKIDNNNKDISILQNNNIDTNKLITDNTDRIYNVSNQVNTNTTNISILQTYNTLLSNLINKINNNSDQLSNNINNLEIEFKSLGVEMNTLHTNKTMITEQLNTIYRGSNSMTLTNSIPIQEPITSDIMVGNILLGYDSNNHTSIQSVIPADYSLAGGRLDLCTTRSNKDPRQIPRISILSGAGGNGNVGIGTTNPSTNLDVIGTARITKTLLVNNIVMGSTTLKNSGNNSTNFILPDSNGNNGNVLMTDGNGNTSWIDNKQPVHIRYSDIPSIISYWDSINNNYNTVSNYDNLVSNYYYLSWVNNIPKDQNNLSNNNWNNGLFTVQVNGLYNINISLQTNTQVYLFISKGNDSNPAISSSTNIINNLTDYNTLIISNISNNINNQFYITNINTIVSLLTTDYLIFGLYSTDNGALIANSTNIAPNSQFTITLVQRT